MRFGALMTEVNDLPGWAHLKPGLTRIDRLRLLAPEALSFVCRSVIAQQFNANSPKDPSLKSSQRIQRHPLLCAIHVTIQYLDGCMYCDHCFGRRDNLQYCFHRVSGFQPVTSQGVFFYCNLFDFT